MPLPTSITDAYERWHQPILETIETAVPRPTTPGDGTLSDMLWYHLDTGGKRLRPLLALMGAEALGGNPQHALPFACGIELLHNATLVHDDYQDGDTVRRGRPTVWREYGWEQSINAGDGFYFAGMKLVAQSPIPGDDLRRLLAITSNRLYQVVGGQVEEFRLKGKEKPSESAYIDVIRGKTAGLFALPLEGAAVCAGLNDAEVARVAETGDTLGLLFQVQDDLLDLIGDKGRDRPATDIAEGKPSLPVVYALANASATDANDLATIVQKPRPETTNDDIERACAILESTGAIDYGLDTIRRWKNDITSSNKSLQMLLTDITTAIVEPIATRI